MESESKTAADIAKEYQADLARFCALQNEFINQISDDTIREELSAALERMMRAVMV